MPNAEGVCFVDIGHFKDNQVSGHVTVGHPIMEKLILT